MKHRHEYESIYHPSPTAEAKALGITAVEIRKCMACQKETIFVLTKSEWFPLFEDGESEEQDILLA